MTPGGSTISTCAAQGVPEPRLVWLKNGKMLSPGDDIWLPHNKRYLRDAFPSSPTHNSTHL